MIRSSRIPYTTTSLFLSLSLSLSIFLFPISDCVYIPYQTACSDSAQSHRYRCTDDVACDDRDGDDGGGGFIARRVNRAERACLARACGRGLIHAGEKKWERDRHRGRRKRPSVSKRDRCGVKERGLYVQTEKESRTRQLRARAYVCVRSWPRLCTRRLDRRLLGPNEGRRREAKDDVVLGWRDSYGEKVGWIRVRAKAWEGRGGVAGKAAKRDSGEGMITGYHISGSLLRVLRSPPSLPPPPFLLFDDPSSSSSPPSPRLPSVYPHLLRRSCSSSRRCTDRCRATSTSADSFCLFFFLLFAFRLLTLSLPASLFHALLRPPLRLVPLPLLVLLFLRVLSIHLPHPIHHVRPSLTLFPLQIDFAATWPRRNAITLSVCSLPPSFSFSLSLSLSLFFSTLALFFSFDYTRPLLFALRERHRATLSRGWGCAGCAIGTSNHALWNRYIRVVFEGIAGYETSTRRLSRYAR